MVKNKPINMSTKYLRNAPHQSILLGQYDTDSNIAYYLIKNILLPILQNVNKYIYDDEYIFIEPGAGLGSFYEHLLPHRIGIEIDETLDQYVNHPYIYEDFLNIDGYGELLRRYYNDYKKNPECINTIDYITKIVDHAGLPGLKMLTVVVGNPPFSIPHPEGGTTDGVAAFINHASRFADTVAMIVPSTYSKKSMQNRIDREFHLYASIDLGDPYIFTQRHKAPGEKDWPIYTLFQVWGKVYDKDGKPILRKVKDETDHTKTVWEIIKNVDGTWYYRVQGSNDEFKKGPFTILRPVDPRTNIIIKKWAHPKGIGRLTTYTKDIKRMIKNNKKLEEKRQNDPTYDKYIKKNEDKYILDRSHVPDYYLHCDDPKHIESILKKADFMKYCKRPTGGHTTLSQVNMIRAFLDALHGEE